MGDVREELNRLAERIANIVGVDNLENTALDAIEADLRALSARAAVPEGWRIERKSDEVILLAPPGAETYEVHAPASLLYMLCDAMLAAAPQPAGEVMPRQPDGYAYRYPSQSLFGGTEIRFSRGQEINGSKPIEAGPYYFGTPPETATSAPATIKSNHSISSNGCVDSSAPSPGGALSLHGAAGRSASRAPADVEDEVAIAAHWLQNIGSAAALLEGTGNIMDRREAEALRKLVKSARCLSAPAVVKDCLTTADVEAERWPGTPCAGIGCQAWPMCAECDDGDCALAFAFRCSGAQQVASITGELVEIGDDAEGQPRLVIHTTREVIAACRASLLFKPVVVQAAKDGAS